MRVVLTIAGSDSGGGAGIQADLKTFQRFGVFGTTVITAVTAQNTRGVTGWAAVDAAMVRAQLDAVAIDLRPAACKSGMLANEAVVEAVASGLLEHALVPYVCDPVMVATSGDPLLAAGAVQSIARDLFPLAALVTPNLDEAELLLKEPVRTPEAMRAAARRIVHELGAGAALVKGGHLVGDELTDVFFDGAHEETFVHARVRTTSTHGSGCTLSAAIAAQLALGASLRDAVALSLAWVHEAIESAPGLGSGKGPLNHFA